MGSFSTKNSGKYELVFNTPGQRIVAFFDFVGAVGRHATITFHPVVTMEIQGGKHRENANRVFYFQAPHPAIFAIVNSTFNVVLQPAFDTYWLKWSQDYKIIVGGVV